MLDRIGILGVLAIAACGGGQRDASRSDGPPTCADVDNYANEQLDFSTLNDRIVAMECAAMGWSEAERRCTLTTHSRQQFEDCLPAVVEAAVDAGVEVRSELCTAVDRAVAATSTQFEGERGALVPDPEGEEDEGEDYFEGPRLAYVPCEIRVRGSDGALYCPVFVTADRSELDTGYQGWMKELGACLPSGWTTNTTTEDDLTITAWSADHAGFDQPRVLLMYVTATVAETSTVAYRLAIQIDHSPRYASLCEQITNVQAVSKDGFAAVRGAKIEEGVYETSLSLGSMDCVIADAQLRCELFVDAADAAAAYTEVVTEVGGCAPSGWSARERADDGPSTTWKADHKKTGAAIKVQRWHEETGHGISVYLGEKL